MLERTEGAPQTPVPTDDEAYKETLRTMLRSGAISPEQAAEMWAAYSKQRRPATASEAAEDYKGSQYPGRLPGGESPRRSYDNPRSPEEIQADMAELDVRLRGIRDDSAARRAEKERGMGMPSADGYEARVGMVPSPTAEMEQEGQDLADSRMYGRRHGGGAPLRSAGEREAYEQRRTLTDAEKQAMRQQGASEADIIDASRSPADRDRAKAGRSGNSGWVPVYAPDGTVTYRERAASHSGATNRVEGQPRGGFDIVGDEVMPTGDRADLRRRGYEPRQVPGPYGVEMVWEKTELGNELEDRLAAEGSLMVDDDGEGPGEPRKITLAEYQQREKQRGTRRRLMDRAGLSSSQAADMSVQNLRDLVRDNRAASEAERKEAARLARMAPRMRNEFELGRMDDDWRNAVAARQLGLQGPTPLGVQAAQAAQAMELAQQMVRGLEASDNAQDFVLRQKMASDAAKRAREIAEEMGVAPADNWWRVPLATPEQLLEIQERVEAEYPGFGVDATRGWRPRAQQPAPAEGEAAPPAPSPWPVPDPRGSL